MLNLKTKPQTFTAPPLATRRLRATAGKWTVVTPTQLTAAELDSLDVIVFPQPYGEKSGAPWKMFQWTRLHRTGNIRGEFGLLHAFQGRCNIAALAGRVSGNLFFLDCETAAAFTHMIKQLTALRIPVWAVRSPSTKAGGHIWLRCTDGELENIPKDAGYRDLEVWGRAHYVICPGSRHPEPRPGNPLYQWERRDGTTIPAVTLDQLADLTDLDGHPLPLKLATSKKRAAAHDFTPINRQTQQYMTSGATYTEGRRRMALFEAAADFARCNIAGYPGYTLGDAFTTLRPIARASALPEHEIDRAISEAFRFVTQPTRKGTPRATAGTAHNWQYAAAFADARAWSGRTGRTDAAVFAALVERARKGDYGGAFRASSYELAELARMSRATVISSLKRLQAAELITSAGSDGVSKTDYTAAAKGDSLAQHKIDRAARLWKFGETVLTEGSRIVKTDPLLSVPNGLSSSRSIFTTSDAIERGALGRSGMHIYETMLQMDSGATLKEIAAAANVSYEQARYAIKGRRAKRTTDTAPPVENGGLLMRSGLVTEKAGYFYAQPATPQQLDDLIARPQGVLGKGAARRAKYAEQRAIYAGERTLHWRYRYDYENLFWGGE